METQVSTSKHTLCESDLHQTAASLPPLMAPPASSRQHGRSVKCSKALVPAVDELEAQLKAPFCIAAVKNLDTEQKPLSDPWHGIDKGPARAGVYVCYCGVHISAPKNVQRNQRKCRLHELYSNLSDLIARWEQSTLPLI